MAVATGQRQRRKTSYRRIFDFKQPLDGEKEYPSGQVLRYPFKIKVPDTTNLANKPEGMMGDALQAAQFLSGASTVITWNLIAKLDCSGLDVNKKVQVNIA